VQSRDELEVVALRDDVASSDLDQYVPAEEAERARHEQHPSHPRPPDATEEKRPQIFDGLDPGEPSRRHASIDDPPVFDRRSVRDPDRRADRDDALRILDDRLDRGEQRVPVQI